MKLSVIIPVYNAEDSIKRLVPEVLAVTKAEQIVLVNDGSRDNSAQICKAIAEEYPQVIFVNLRKNFGEHNAVMCGLAHCAGDYAAIIDDDFQNPPQEINKLMAKAEQGYDVVYAKYEQKFHSTYRNFGSSFTNRVATYLLKKPADLYLASFKVINRAVIDEIIKYQGPFPYIDGLIFRVTNNITSELATHQAREQGRSNYTLKKLISLYLNMFLNFSILPLRIFTVLGFAALAAGLIVALWVLLEWIFVSNLPPGYASLVFLLLLFSGIQLIFIGLLGEYLGKHYLHFNGTPQWVVKEVVSSEKSSKSKTKIHGLQSNG